MMDFSTLEVKKTPVNNLLGKNYVLVEANGETAKTHRNTLFKSVEMTINHDGKITPKFTSMTGMAEVEMELVSNCLFEVAVDGNLFKRPVGIEFVKGLPNGVIKSLFNEAKRISSLDEGTPEVKDLTPEQKKILENTTDGSS